MRMPWPEDEANGALLDDVFEQALRQKERSYVLLVPAAVMRQGAEAIRTWLEENHPGHPVIVVPEPPRTCKDWISQLNAEGWNVWDALQSDSAI